MAADADVKVDLGFDEHESLANGNGTARLKKTKRVGKVEGLVVPIDHENGDVEFFEDVMSGGFVPCTITLAGGTTTYQAKCQVGGELSFSTQDGTIELTLVAEGRWTRQ